MKNLFALFVLSIFIFSCGPNKPKGGSEIKPLVETKVKHPDWAKDAVIYEVNIRQHTPEGTFKAFTQDLPRLKELGVDILWLMPIFPIGEKFMKADQFTLVEELDNPSEIEKVLGSYYAIKDFNTVNPEFGSEEDFKELMDAVHKSGMKVILDIAINHTAWDHPWVKDHPDYYVRIDTSNVSWNKEWMKDHPEFYHFLKQQRMTYPIDPNETDWWDTAELNLENKDLRKELIEIFKFWIEKYNIDGYRCDVAWGVPADFWDNLRPDLDKLKPVFMLAESEAEYYFQEKAFDMNYTWELHHMMNEVAQGKNDVNGLVEIFEKYDSIYSKDCYRMQFITNHDENSWKGSEFERMGDGVETFAVMTFTIPGMPLLYSGQEVGMDKRLRFFHKDTVTYTENNYPAFYKSLIDLKTDNKVLWNGAAGGDFEILDANSDIVFAFKRFTDETELFVLLNLSGNAQDITVPEGINGAYTDYFTQQSVVMSEGEELTLNSWDYKVLIEK